MASNSVNFMGDKLVIEPKGLDKIWSFTYELEIPLSHIKGATIDDGILNEGKGLRGPGLGLPGKWAGTFTKKGAITFFNIQRPEKAVVIQLQDEHFERLVLGVDTPNELVDRLNNLGGN